MLSVEQCPHCGEELKKSDFESTYTNIKLRCQNPKCKKPYSIKTGLGKLAEVGPLVVAAGVLLKIGAFIVEEL